MIILQSNEKRAANKYQYMFYRAKGSWYYSAANCLCYDILTGGAAIADGVNIIQGKMND